MAKVPLQDLVHVARRLVHVLAMVGWDALLRKVRRRFFAPAFRVPRRPHIRRPDVDCRPVPFAQVIAPAVSIVVPVRKERRMGVCCLAALQGHESRYSFEVIVLEDESLEEAVSVFSTWAGVRVVSGSINAGMARSFDTGGSAFNGEYVVFLEDVMQIGRAHV